VDIAQHAVIADMAVIVRDHESFDDIFMVDAAGLFVDGRSALKSHHSPKINQL
jgi:hypothetical protein